MMRTKRIIALLLGMALTASALTACNRGSSSDMGEMSTMEIVKDMGMGINLGNTLEACGDWINSSSVTNYETAWGSPVITEDMIKGYRAAGFGVLRVPVAWSNMMAEDYTTHPDYIARAKEIVDWALNADLYVILNIHYDGGWWTEFPTDKENCMHKYVRIWEQLSGAFEEYDEHLMFEFLNEEGGWDSLWNRYSGTLEGKDESFGLLNEINQTFVDTVRDSGGNNAQRHLLIAGYTTDVELTCDALFKMPKDPANRCAVSVHYYTPSTFCILTEDAVWGKARTEWGSEKDIAELNKYMDMLKTNFVDKGYPVIIGEYGVAAENKTREMINLYVTSVCEAAYIRDMCPVLWSTTGNFYNRDTCTVYDTELNEAMRGIVGAE